MVSFRLQVSPGHHRCFPFRIQRIIVWCQALRSHRFRVDTLYTFMLLQAPYQYRVSFFAVLIKRTSPVAAGDASVFPLGHYFFAGIVFIHIVAGCCFISCFRLARCAPLQYVFVGFSDAYRYCSGAMVFRKWLSLPYNGSPSTYHLMIKSIDCSVM